MSAIHTGLKFTDAVLHCIRDQAAQVAVDRSAGYNITTVVRRGEPAREHCKKAMVDFMY